MYPGRVSPFNSVQDTLDSLFRRLQLQVLLQVQPLYGHLEPLTVQYDGDINLMGFALGQSDEQLSSRQLLSPERDRALWMVLSWETNLDMDTDFADFAAPVQQ